METDHSAPEQAGNWGSILNQRQQHISGFQEYMPNMGFRPARTETQGWLYLREYGRTRGWNLRDVRRDGRCFFHAFVDGIQHITGERLPIADVVQEAANYMWQNYDSFLPFHAALPGEGRPRHQDSNPDEDQERNFDNYIARLSRGGVQGDELVIRALSENYNVGIEVFDGNQRTFIRRGNQAESTVRIAFVPNIDNNDLDNGHYMAYIPYESESLGDMEAVLPMPVDIAARNRPARHDRTIPYCEQSRQSFSTTSTTGKVIVKQAYRTLDC